MRWCLLIVLALLAACGAPAPPPAPAPDAFVPPFARVPYEPFSRQSVVAIALREWRLFGQPVDDDPPDMRPPLLPEEMPQREPGLWQRVGEYWWLGMDSGSKEAGWTGKHDATGVVFPASVKASYAWSAAFVSYVMRIAGAGPRFPYAPNHAHYIDIAKEMALGETHGWLITAERPNAYAPQQGDLICAGRDRAASMTYDDLPKEYFPAHCAIVVDTSVPSQISVIGGNVDSAVTLTHVPVTPDGRLAGPDGRILDTRYPWMVVLRLLVGASPVA
jgi:hypothetical protein